MQELLATVLWRLTGLLIKSLVTGLIHRLVLTPI
jgi:hypothetical protein